MSFNVKLAKLAAKLLGINSGKLLGIDGNGDVTLVDASALMPAGAVMDFGMVTAPTGWLECDGSAISRAANPNLFAAIGTTWGAGDGSTTFNLPDFRGTVRRSWDHGKGLDSGRNFATYQADGNKSHNHTVNDPGHSHNVYTDVSIGPSSMTSGSLVTGVSRYGTDSSNGALFSSGTGISLNSSGGAETTMKNYAVLTCIKV